MNSCNRITLSVTSLISLLERGSEMNWEGYWAKARYHYFRDSTDGSWGVAVLPIKIVARGMSQLHAAAFACLLNGDIEHAKELRDAAHTEPNQRNP